MGQSIQIIGEAGKKTKEKEACGHRVVVLFYWIYCSKTGQMLRTDVLIRAAEEEEEDLSQRVSLSSVRLSFSLVLWGQLRPPAHG